MREISLIIAASIRNNLRMKIMVAVQIAVLLICVAAPVAAFCYLVISPAMEAPDRAVMETYLSVILYFVCLICVGINMNVFGFQTMTREKSRGSIAALLATPLKAEHIWIAKSLAVFLPGLVIGIVLSLISLLAVNYAYFVPATGFVFNPWMAVSALLAVPLIYLGLSLLSHLIGLSGKPATGNVIVQVFLPVFASLMINLGVRDVLDAASWQFALANLGVAVVIGVIAILLRPRLTSERIILSQ